jgi:hypothetical protein
VPDFMFMFMQEVMRGIPICIYLKAGSEPPKALRARPCHEHMHKHKQAMQV